MLSYVLLVPHVAGQPGCSLNMANSPCVNNNEDGGGSSHGFSLSNASHYYWVNMFWKYWRIMAHRANGSDDNPQQCCFGTDERVSPLFLRCSVDLPLAPQRMCIYISSAQGSTRLQADVTLINSTSKCILVWMCVAFVKYEIFSALPKYTKQTNKSSAQRRTTRPHTSSACCVHRYGHPFDVRIYVLRFADNEACALHRNNNKW